MCVGLSGCVCVWCVWVSVKMCLVVLECFVVCFTVFECVFELGCV